MTAGRSASDSDGDRTAGAGSSRTGAAKHASARVRGTTVAIVAAAVAVALVAAGGIGDGRGVAAALMLGAQGVQVGTRFLVADECTVSEEYKSRVLKAKDISTIVTGRRDGHPVRCLKTPFTTTYARLENEGVSEEELGKLGAGALRKAAKDGNYDEGSFMCGQIAGMVSSRQTALEIVDDLVEGAEQLLKGAPAWVQ